MWGTNNNAKLILTSQLSTSFSTRLFMSTEAWLADPVTAVSYSYGQFCCILVQFVISTYKDNINGANKSFELFHSYFSTFYRLHSFLCLFIIFFREILRLVLQDNMTTHDYFLNHKYLSLMLSRNRPLSYEHDRFLCQTLICRSHMMVVVHLDMLGLVVQPWRDACLTADPLMLKHRTAPLK